MSVNSLELSLSVILRNKKAFEQVRHFIDPVSIDNCLSNRAITLLYQLVWDFYKKTNDVPDPIYLTAQIKDLYKNNKLDLTREERNYLQNIFNKIYSVDEKYILEEKNVIIALKQLKELLNKYYDSNLVQSIIRDPENCDIDDIIAKIQEKKKSLDNIDCADNVEELFPPNWDQEQKYDFIPTFFGPLDRFFGGGMLPEEIYAFMGPFGSCKTTLAIQISVNLAEYASDLYLRGESKEGKIPVSFFISTETPKSEVRLRILSYAAKIPRERLQFTKLSSLCKENRPGAIPETKYELMLYGNNDKRFISEYERAMAKTELLNKHFIFLDCSGNDPKFPTAGYNGILDVKNFIDRIIQKYENKIYPIFICIDHASGLASRILEGNQSKYKLTDLRFILKDIVRTASIGLAKHYKVPVFITHQLSGVANTKGPTGRVHHTDAAECKSFAEFVDFAITTSQLTQDKRQLARLICTKHRRQPPKDHAIVKLLGQFNWLVDVSKDYTIDPSERDFVRKGDDFSLGYQGSFSDDDDIPPLSDNKLSSSSDNTHFSYVNSQMMI